MKSASDVTGMCPQPCHGCRFRGDCVTEALVNRLAVESWLENSAFSCPEYRADNYHGIEGVLA